MGAQELRLELERQLADLVEEHGAAVGGLEGADALAIRAREGAAHVPEELALDEVRRDRAAVDDDERLVGPRPALEDLRRDELLAGAALALDEHVDVARRDLLEEGEELAHGDAGAGERAERVGRLDFGEGDGRRRLEPARVKEAVAERERALALEVGVADAHAVELRSVERAVVLHPPAPAVARQLAVEARDRGVEQHEIVAGMRPDVADRSFVDEDARLPARFTAHFERQLGDDVDGRLHDAGPGVAPQRRRLLVGQSGRGPSFHAPLNDCMVAWRTQLHWEGRGRRRRFLAHGLFHRLLCDPAGLLLGPLRPNTWSHAKPVGLEAL